MKGLQWFETKITTVSCLHQSPSSVKSHAATAKAFIRGYFWNSCFQMHEELPCSNVLLTDSNLLFLIWLSQGIVYFAFKPSVRLFELLDIFFYFLYVNISVSSAICKKVWYCTTTIYSPWLLMFISNSLYVICELMKIQIK